MNITREQFIVMTANLKPVSESDQRYWWSQDYCINGNLVRFSSMRYLDAETLSLLNSDSLEMTYMNQDV